MILAFPIALAALGNRLWGEGKASHAIGLLVMSLGACMHVMLWWHIPLFVATIFFWRFRATKPWLDMTDRTKTDWTAGFVRSLYFLPYIIARVVANAAPLEVVLLMSAIFLTPAIYWATARWQRRIEPVALAEFIVGGFVGI